MNDISVINNVEMTYDESTGITHFAPIEDKAPTQRRHAEEKDWLQSLKDWYNGLFIKPYAKVRDFNNGKDTNGENTPQPGVEVGIRIDF